MAENRHVKMLLHAPNARCKDLLTDKIVAVSL